MTPFRHGETDADLSLIVAHYGSATVSTCFWGGSCTNVVYVGLVDEGVHLVGLVVDGVHLVDEWCDAPCQSIRVCWTNSGGESAWSKPASGTTLAAPDISLSASGYKRKGKHFIDFSWSGASSGSVDIRRDNVVISTFPDNSGSDTDETGNKGARTYVYKACEAGSNMCSDEVVVVF